MREGRKVASDFLEYSCAFLILKDWPLNEEEQKQGIRKL